MVTITNASTRDVRFPVSGIDWVSLRHTQTNILQTSLDKTGSDAMNAAGDYSSAYCILHTDSEHSGHGMTFTIGRGNEIVCQAISLLTGARPGVTWYQTRNYVGLAPRRV
jgi:L-galactonate dehydratase